MSTPNGIKKDWSTVTKFMKGSYSICNMILDSLSESMGLEGEKPLQRHMSSPSTSVSLHRIVPHRKRYTPGPRYSVAFFLRPNMDAIFTDDEGRQWAGGDFVNKTLLNYRRSHQDQRGNSLATGQKGFLGLVKEGTSLCWELGSSNGTWAIRRPGVFQRLRNGWFTQVRSPIPAIFL